MNDFSLLKYLQHWSVNARKMFFANEKRSIIHVHFFFFFFDVEAFKIT